MNNDIYSFYQLVEKYKVKIPLGWPYVLSFIPFALLRCKHYFQFVLYDPTLFCKACFTEQVSLQPLTNYNFLTKETAFESISSTEKLLPFPIHNSPLTWTLEDQGPA